MDYTTRDMIVGSDGKLRPLLQEELEQLNAQRRQAEELSRQMQPVIEDERLKERNIVESRLRKEPVATHKAFYNSYLSLLTKYSPEHAYDKAIDSVVLLRKRGIVP